MKKNSTIILSACCFLSLFLFLPQGGNTQSTAEEKTATLTPTPSGPPPTGKSIKAQNPPKTLVIHKPKPNPAWGKVIQYHRDQILALSEKNRETIHEFIFQDEDGVIRTAAFHENAAGEGYWEVWVWDQP